AKLGTHFILQGGTQKNLAVVKAEVDFIESRFVGKDVQPTIRVHEHCGESGAIGAALEAVKHWENGRKQSSFIGFDATSQITYRQTSDETTRCVFCKNKCLRTYIDLRMPAPGAAVNGSSPGSVGEISRRIIVGNACEKGSVEDVKDMRSIKKELDALLDATPNLLDVSIRELFKSYHPEPAFEPVRLWDGSARRQAFAGRKDLVVGIPRVLLLYSFAPLFTAYFESLGIRAGNIVFSDFTSENLYREGGKRGAIDPCFPSKVTVAHIHNLLYEKHKKRALNLIFFPAIGDIDAGLKGTLGAWTCPSIVPSSEVVKACFTKEGDTFASMGITYLNPFLNLAEPKLFERQMFDAFQPVLGLTRQENMRAAEAGFRALDQYRSYIRGQSRLVLDMLERENKIGLVLLGRPYHKDPGINHEIFTEFQKLGYPILAQDILPTDPFTLEQVFGDDIRTGRVKHPLEISDVWKRSISPNANTKLWAAKFVARHPNLVALELSNFKCGHDAPIYTVLEEIIESAGTPFFSFRDIDENKPKGSIRLRIETLDYFLKKYREKMFGEACEPAPAEEVYTEMEPA
ncbi:MAG: acyl-CoA dehydratase activase-related protein, partial [Thermoanaerobaculia bacterium]|nr:acyl-CoA dehydratase activase-related protein [Thermoanaerobaculia bacterium]